MSGRSARGPVGCGHKLPNCMGVRTVPGGDVEPGSEGQGGDGHSGKDGEERTKGSGEDAGTCGASAGRAMSTLAVARGRDLARERGSWGGGRRSGQRADYGGSLVLS